MKCNKTNENLLSKFYNRSVENNDDDSSDEEFIHSSKTEAETSLL